MSVVKYLGLLVIAGLSAASAAAQQRLVAEGRSPSMFLRHTVQKGENYFSLGRRYSLSPREIARINRLNFSEGLRIHQVVRIPLSPANFSHERKGGSQPVYRQVRKGETLFRIGAISGDIPLAELRSWNRLRSSRVEPGQYLIIGWLKRNGPAEEPVVAGRKAGSSAGMTSTDKITATDATAASSTGSGVSQAASGSSQKATDTANTRQADQQNDSFLAEVIADERAKHEGVAGGNAATGNATTGEAKNTTTKTAASPPLSNPNDSDTAQSRFATMLNRVAGGAPAKAPPVSASTPAVRPAHHPAENMPAGSNSNPAESNASSVSPAASGAESTPAGANHNSAESDASSSPFFPLYQQQASSGKPVMEKGAGAWFKSNISASTRRFYALNNNAPRGTVIKVTNPLNGKFVYVKVLDVIPQVSGNANLIIKISDAAMQELGVSAARFFCELEYAK